MRSIHPIKWLYNTKRLALFISILVLFISKPSVLSAQKESSTITTNMPNCTVAFNEILADPVGSDTGNEWIEFYNCGAEQIDLTNWVIKDKSGSKQILTNLKIDPLSYLVLYPTISLNQTNEEIYLYNKSLELVDSFSYTTTKEGLTWAREMDGTGQWQKEVQPTIGYSNFVPEIEYSKEISINEVFAAPDTSQDKDETEWIELYNDSGIEVSLNSWTISDSTTTKALEDLVIPAFKYLLVDNKSLGITLNNSGEKIILQNPKGEIVSEFEYTQTATSISNIRYNGQILQTKKATPNAENIWIDINDCFYDIPEIGIAALREIATESNGTSGGNKYRVKGVISVGQDIVGANRLYIQDETSGILVLLAGTSTNTGVALEHIELVGTVTTYYNEPALKINGDTCLKKVEPSSTLISKSIDLKQSELLKYPGMLITTTGYISKTSGQTVWLTGSLEPEYANQTQDQEEPLVVKTTLPENLKNITKTKGSKVTITGILSVSTNEEGENLFKLYLRDKSDFKISTAEQKTSNISPVSQSNISSSKAFSKFQLYTPKYKRLEEKENQIAVKRETHYPAGQRATIITAKALSGSGILSSFATITFLFKKKI